MPQRADSLPKEKFREGRRRWPPGQTDSKGRERLSPDRLGQQAPRARGHGVGVGSILVERIDSSNLGFKFLLCYL